MSKKPSVPKWEKTKKTLFWIILIVIISVCLRIGYAFFHLAQDNNISLRLLDNVLMGRGSYLKNQDRVSNILILGTGGNGHEKSKLTDSIILMSVRPKNIVLLSIPRDLWSQDLQDKINTAYHYGEENGYGGFALASETLGKILGQKINYTVAVDFQLFKDLIDALGGVEVAVSAAFTDDKYPVAGRENDYCLGDKTLSCRYKSVSFAKGVELMDGDRALEYVRSRHAQGEEGTDFSRSRRQQEVIIAIKNKLTVWRQLFKYDQNIRIKYLVQNMVVSDLKNDEYIALISEIYRRKDNFVNYSIDDLLYVPDSSLYKGRYVLIPVDDGQPFANKINHILSQND